MAEHVKAYSKENPNATFYVDDLLVVDLFPYKIKGRNKFYQRDHPENIHPKSPMYEEYWNPFIDTCIEGKWVEDDNGVWVYMMPKLFFYINYVTILNEDRKTIKPDLCDLEWIFFTYFFCLDGFSGFEDDDKYTCNDLVRRYEEWKNSPKSDEDKKNLELNEIELKNISKNCYSKETGEFKKYINPWDYLTRTYLIDDPRGPLGLPLYENERSHGFILGARGIRKSFTVYMGDFLHEWFFSGVTRKENIADVNSSLLFAMGSGSSSQMNRTLNNIRLFYDSQPGKYHYEDKEGTVDMGPLYKNYMGKLLVGQEFRHIVKETSSKVDLLGSVCQVSAITPDRMRIVAGDRFRRVYVEEVGFIEYIEEVYGANTDSLRLNNKNVGSFIATGTSGDLVAITGSKKMFENPKGFDIFGIRNYWKNSNKYIGLFLPAQYQNRDYDDGNGFVYLDLATKLIKKQREKWYSELDSTNAGLKIIFNPINPDEMLIPNESSILPKKEARQRLSDIESNDTVQRVCSFGELEYDSSYPHGVRFDKFRNNKIQPIEDYNVDFSKVDKKGAFILTEPPPDGKIPSYMYWVIYDPAAKSGDGISLHSILVYKHFLCKDGGLRDTIVGEWIGRHERLEDNYEMVIKIAKYFNAKIFPEINIAGFVEWCKSNNHLSMLQRDSYELQMEITPGHKRSYYRAGYQMNGRTKWWALQKLADWLLDVKRYHPDSGVPELRTIDMIYSKRILNEIIYYNNNDNFDHISSLLGLMLLLGQLESFKPDNDMDNINDDFFKSSTPYISQPRIRERPKFENILT